MGLRISFLKVEKRGQIDIAELVNYIVLLILLGLTIFLMSNSVLSVKRDIEFSAPNLTYQFPVLTVHSFLYQKCDLKQFLNFMSKSQLTKTEDNEINFIKTKQQFYVKDLLFLSSDDTPNFNKYLEQERVSYLGWIHNKQMLDFYNKFSGEDLTCDDLIKIYTKQSVPKIDDLMKNNNYAFYFPDKFGGIKVIEFK